LLRCGGLPWDDAVVSSLSPDAEPFAADGGPVGVLVLHGFTGSPQTIRDWASHLAAAGLTVRAPLLAGHGGSWQELAKTGWTDWYADAERAFLLTQPLLVFRSTEDHVVGPASMKTLMKALPGAQVRPLGNSYHVATLDNDAPEIFDGTLAFIRDHARSQAQ
jgi:esterase/lipase